LPPYSAFAEKKRGQLSDRNKAIATALRVLTVRAKLPRVMSWEGVASANRQLVSASSKTSGLAPRSFLDAVQARKSKGPTMAAMQGVRGKFRAISTRAAALCFLAAHPLANIAPSTPIPQTCNTAPRARNNRSRF